MSIQVQINSVDKSDLIQWENLRVKQNINEAVDTAVFMTRKYGDRSFEPVFGDDVAIYDGGIQIFGGTVISVKEYPESGGGGMVYEAKCVDYGGFEIDKKLVSETYENQTIKQIITDILSNYASDFDADNVESEFTIDKIVFNQVPVSECIRRLAEIVNFHFYVDYLKSVHFFDKLSKEAPFDLTDTSGNYVYKSLERNNDGSQVVNIVKVRGGEYNGNSFTDVITVSGNDSKSFKLPYKFANLTIEVDAGGGYVGKTVGTDFIDDFTSKDVLHNYQDQSFRFETALSNGNKIRFSGNPKVRVLAIAQDSDSVATYGEIEKIIRDNNIKDNAVARRRAAAELLVYKEPIVDAVFYTKTSGLRVGMKINVSSARRSSNDDFIIKSITFAPISNDNFGYKVSCVTTKTYDLISLLQKILQPESLDSDEVETNEKIFADSVELSISEDHEVISPQEDNAIIAIGENIQLNPFNPSNIRWVWGYYAPTGMSDVKRMAKWDRDAKWQ